MAEKQPDKRKDQDENPGDDFVEMVNEKGVVTGNVSKNTIIVDGIEKPYEEAYEEKYGEQNADEQEGDKTDS